MTQGGWDAVGALPDRTLTALFAEETDRLSRMAIEEAGLLFDFAKTHLSAAHIAAFVELCEARGLAARRDATPRCRRCFGGRCGSR